MKVCQSRIGGSVTNKVEASVSRRTLYIITTVCRWFLGEESDACGLMWSRLAGIISEESCSRSGYQHWCLCTIFLHVESLLH